LEASQQFSFYRVGLLAPRQLYYFSKVKLATERKYNIKMSN
jgi:hypothetical protein